MSECKIDKSVLEMNVEIKDAGIIFHPAVRLLENEISNMIEDRSRMSVTKHNIESKEYIEAFNERFDDLNDALRILVNELRKRENKKS